MTIEILILTIKLKIIQSKIAEIERRKIGDYEEARRELGYQEAIEYVLSELKQINH